MDGLIEALRAAGVASESALEAQVTAELSLVDYEPEQVWKSEGIIAAITADRDVVLRVLLEAERDERDRKRRWAGTATDASRFEHEWLVLDQALSLLAPEGTR